MNLIFLGDVVGKGGRNAVKKLLPELRREFNAQFAVINGENAAAGNGLSGTCLTELLTVADVVTSGDHTWDQKGFESEIGQFDRCIRPANFSALQPGRGYGIFRHVLGGEVAVISLLGKVFMRDSAYCPFETAERILSELPSRVRTILVDFHAEATSEKLAMGYFLDGKVTAVIGTHTHVQTADARVLPGGTAVLTDAGMCGAETSVLGREVDAVLKKFRTGMPVRLPVAESGPIRVDGAVLAYDGGTGRAMSLTPFSRIVELG
ncbi:MAG: YmdB family metallophosphoesterase [Lentisphaeria bacterium]|nr:YmdB family metallophosphoesterase [Lentisphaeria bacterium]